MECQVDFLRMELVVHENKARKVFFVFHLHHRHHGVLLLFLVGCRVEELWDKKLGVDRTNLLVTVVGLVHFEENVVVVSDCIGVELYSKAIVHVLFHQAPRNKSSGVLNYQYFTLGADVGHCEKVSEGIGAKTTNFIRIDFEVSLADLHSVRLPDLESDHVFLLLSLQPLFLGKLSLLIKS